jgi:hypothetical protein
MLQRARSATVITICTVARKRSGLARRLSTTRARGGALPPPIGAGAADRTPTIAISAPANSPFHSHQQQDHAYFEQHCRKFLARRGACANSQR